MQQAMDDVGGAIEECFMRMEEGYEMIHELRERPGHPRCS